MGSYSHEARALLVDLGGGTWELSFLGTDSAAVDVRQRLPGTVYIELACQDFMDCVTGPVSVPFGLVAYDPPIRFYRDPAAALPALFAAFKARR